MKELVYAKGTQANPEKKDEDAKDGKKSLFGPLGLMGVATAGVAAYNALAQTDFDKIIDTMISLTKQPVIAVGVMIAYAISVVMSRE